MHRVERRMRFLAVYFACSALNCIALSQRAATFCGTQADSASTLRGQYPSYRQLLLRLCQKLDLKCPSSLMTEVWSCSLVCASENGHPVCKQAARSISCIIVTYVPISTCRMQDLEVEVLMHILDQQKQTSLAALQNITDSKQASTQ